MGPWGGAEAPIEKVVVLQCSACASNTNSKGGKLPVCQKCAARCIDMQECPLKHNLGQGRSARGRHLPYFTLEKCINLA